jgi:hypothetical protein
VADVDRLSGATPSTTVPSSGSDVALIDDALGVVRHARARVSGDFLLALSVVLALLAITLVTLAALSTGTLQDLLLNLSAEVAGAWLTVVLVDGLWKRLQGGASSGFDSMTHRLEERRTSRLTDDERQAWRRFVDEYNVSVRSESPLARARALPRYATRLHALETRGNRTLEEFRHVAEEQARAE